MRSGVRAKKGIILLVTSNFHYAQFSLRQRFAGRACPTPTPKTPISDFPYTWRFAERDLIIRCRRPGAPGYEHEARVRRFRTIFLLGTAVGALIIWSLFLDAWKLRMLVKALEGEHALDVMFEGKVAGRLSTSFSTLDGFGIVMRSSRDLQVFADSDPATTETLVFGGFPGYELLGATRSQGAETESRTTRELPQWSLYEQLALHRLVFLGKDALRSMRGYVELVSSEALADADSRATLRVDTFDPFEGKRTAREIEVAWDAAGKVRLNVGEAWYQLDQLGRIVGADVPGIYQLVPSSEPNGAPIAATLPPAGQEVGRIVPLTGEVASPRQVSAMRLRLSALGSRLLNTSEFIPQQRVLEREIRVANGLREVPGAIRDLVRRVHESLEYQEVWSHALDAQEILARGRGDCTEFTDLFAAQAEAAGLKVRKILGLAYLANQSDRPAGFQVHAWNQVQVDGVWMDVDATWNQASPSAMRIRFPLDPVRQLSLLLNLDALELELLDIEYLGDRSLIDLAQSAPRAN